MPPMRPTSGHRTGGHRRFGLLATAVRLPAMLLARWDIPELMPAAAPVIISGNHRSLFDVVVGFRVFWNCGASVRIVVAGRYFDHWLAGRLLRMGGCIPMSGGRAALSGVKACLAALERGETVVIMPEGRVIPPEERPGGVGPPGDGIGLLAARGEAPLGIAIITGTDEVWPPGRRLPRLAVGRARPTVRVRLESLVPLEPSLRRDRRRVAAVVMDALAERLEATAPTTAPTTAPE